MRGLYEHFWVGHGWRSRGWWILWLSPIPLTLLLAFLPLFFDETHIAYVTLFVWTTVAGVSAVFADIMRRRARKATRAAQRKCRSGDPTREFAKLNHGVASSIEIVHSAFLLVGLATILLPEDWEFRKVITRDGILIGQYILMLVVLRTYYIDQVLRKLLKNEKA